MLWPQLHYCSQQFSLTLHRTRKLSTIRMQDATAGEERIIRNSSSTIGASSGAGRLGPTSFKLHTMVVILGIRQAKSVLSTENTQRTIGDNSIGYFVSSNRTNQVCCFEEEGGTRLVDEVSRMLCVSCLERDLLKPSQCLVKKRGRTTRNQPTALATGDLRFSHRTLV